EAAFRKALNRISSENQEIDIAMFPVAPRLGTDFGEGAKEFLTEIKVNNFLPMHFWGMKDEALTFLSTIQGDKSNVHFISTPGASVEIK
ncbi:MAG: hypothetical protein K2H50_07675, partial [Paramuribaculum sp.]|nr:hypothetical protein [Paramuribaculum sp.]